MNRKKSPLSIFYIFCVFVNLSSTSYLSSDKIKFTNYVYTFTSAIGESANSPIGTIYFSNSTVYNSNNFEYSIISADGNKTSDLFRLELTKTGLAVHTRQQISSFNNSVNFFKVYATRRNDQKIAAKCYLVVRLVDNVRREQAKRSPPTFKRSMYEAQIYENNAPDTIVIRVEASSANFAHLTYHLVSFNDPFAKSISESGFSSSPFQIKSDSGEIYVKRMLNREHRDLYVLTVLAIESGLERLNATTQVFIRIMEQNELTLPQTDSTGFNLTLPETTDYIKRPVVFKIADRVLRNSKEPSQPLVYSLSGSMNDLNTFEIDSRTGEIHLVSKLNFEIKPLYKLTVVISDQSMPASSTYSTLYINVENTMLVPPTFQTPFYEFILFENATLNYRVGRVMAYYLPKSSIKNKHIQYSLETSGHRSESFPFRIDPQNGTIFTTQKLSKYIKQNYEFYVVTTGGNNNGASAKVKVRVLDLNDNVPEFAKKSFVLNITEDAAIGLPLLTLTVINRDQTSLLEYSIESNDDSDVTGIFTIIKQLPTRVYFTLDRANLNFKKKSIYSLNVRVIDQDGLYSYAHVLVNVLPNFEYSPRFAQDIYAFELYENAKMGTFIGKVDALAVQDSRVVYKMFYANTDNFVENGLEYSSVTEDDVKNSDFKLDEQTGKIRFQRIS
jgi:hypothetical protein